MKRWVIITDRAAELRDWKGQVEPAALPDPDAYDVGDWLEVVVSDDAPRAVWRVLCADVPLT